MLVLRGEMPWKDPLKKKMEGGCKWKKRFWYISYQQGINQKMNIHFLQTLRSSPTKYHSLKLTGLKVDGWNTILSFWVTVSVYFQGIPSKSLSWNPKTMLSKRIQKESPSLAVPFSGSMLNFRRGILWKWTVSTRIFFGGRSIFRRNSVSFREGSQRSPQKSLSQLSLRQNVTHLTPGEDIWT